MGSHCFILFYGTRRRHLRSMFVVRGQFCILHIIIERHFLVQVLRCGHDAIRTRRYACDFGSSTRTRYFVNLPVIVAQPASLAL